MRPIHSILTWILVGIVLLGQGPALLHRAQCQHDGCCVPATSLSPSDDHVCRVCNPGLRQAEAGKAFHPHDVADDRSKVKSQTTLSSDPGHTHDCSNCLICRSLKSPNGHKAISVSCLALSACRFEEALASGGPLPARYGIFQSRAPPSCL